MWKSLAMYTACVWSKIGSVPVKIVRGSDAFRVKSRVQYVYSQRVVFVGIVPNNRKAIKATYGF